MKSEQFWFLTCTALCLVVAVSGRTPLWIGEQNVTVENLSVSGITLTDILDRFNQAKSGKPDPVTDLHFDEAEHLLSWTSSSKIQYFAVTLSFPDSSETVKVPENRLLVTRTDVTAFEVVACDQLCSDPVSRAFSLTPVTHSVFMDKNALGSGDIFALVASPFEFSSTQYQSVGSLSIEMVVNPSPAAHDMCLFSFRDSEDANALGVFLMADGSLRVYYDGRSEDSPYSIPRNTYSHLVFTFDVYTLEHTLMVYRNGHRQVSHDWYTVLPRINSTGDLAIGNDFDNAYLPGGRKPSGFAPNNQFFGKIALFRVWVGALSGGDVARLAQKFFSPPANYDTWFLTAAISGALISNYEFEGTDILRDCTTSRNNDLNVFTTKTPPPAAGCPDDFFPQLAPNRGLGFKLSSHVAQYEGPFPFPAPDFTVSLWVSLSPAGERFLLSYGHPRTVGMFALSISNTSLNVYNTEKTVYAVPSSLMDGQLHHVAVSYHKYGGSGASLAVYLDGNAVFDEQIPSFFPIAAGGTLVLGQKVLSLADDGSVASVDEAYALGANHSSAFLDQIRIHSTARSQIRIQEDMYRCGEWAPISADPSLVAAYSMDTVGLSAGPIIDLAFDEGPYGLDLRCNLDFSVVFESSFPSCPLYSHLR